MIQKPHRKTLSYKAKIMLCYLLVIAIPYSIGLVSSYNSIVRTTETNLLSAIENRMDQELSSIEMQLESIRSSAYFFSTNSFLRKFFTPNFYTDIQLVELVNNTILPIMSWMEILTKDTGNFRFFTPLANLPENEFLIHSSTCEDEFWMQNMVQKVAESGFYFEPFHEYRTFLYNKPQNGSVFSLFYQLSGTNLESPTYLEIEIHPDQLFHLLNETPVLQDGFLICLDDAGNEITNLLSEQADKSLLKTKELLDFTSSSKSGYFTSEFSSYYISSRRIEALHATLLCMIPKESISEPALKAQLLFLLIVCSLTLLLLGLSYIISTLLLRRIQRMRRAVHKMQEGDFNIHIPIKGNDEIDELALSMNTMSVKINDLINTVYKAEVRQKETEILALHAQINPHFLFNTLETFRMMAEVNDLTTLSDSIAMLGNLMRYNIILDRHLVALEEELSICSDYVCIQNLLHNNRIVLIEEIPGGLCNLLLPNLIFQPLIENSILHGLYEGGERITIRIRVEELQNQFMVTIQDNGAGTTPERLELIRKKLNGTEMEESNRKSIGLVNVHQRLILFFGPESGLQLSSAFGEKFIVQFSIPKNHCQRKEY